VPKAGLQMTVLDIDLDIIARDDESEETSTEGEFVEGVMATV
jgi:single-strand DNA-binding protein